MNDPHMDISALLERTEMEFPEAPDLVASVMTRVEEERRDGTRAPVLRAPRWMGRTALAGVAALAVALLVLSLSLPARRAVADLLGIVGIEITFDDEAAGELGPDAPELQDADLGREVSVADAAGVVDFEVRGPSAATAPARIYYDPAIGDGGMLSTLFRPEGAPLHLITEFRADFEADYLKKIPSPGTIVQPVAVDGVEGYWLSGRPHAFAYVDGTGFREETVRLAGNVLLWDRSGVVYRIEGPRTLADALEIAGRM